jgi:hypothetical protein
VKAGGWENIYIGYIPSEKNKHYEGLNLVELGEKVRKSPFHAITDLMIEEKGAISQLIFGVSGDRENEEPIKAIIRHPLGGYATDAVDRLHSTAEAHHRVMIVEVMGHRAGWIALYAGVAGGGDIILIPEIPYRVEAVVQAVRDRTRKGKRFSTSGAARRTSSGRSSRAMRSMVGSISKKVMVSFGSW